MSPSTVGLTMADCPSWLQPRVKAAAERLTRKEHREITKDVLEGSLETIRAAVAKYRTQSEATDRAKRLPQLAPGMPDVGPGWIPGACVPKVSPVSNEAG